MINLKFFLFVFKILTFILVTAIIIGMFFSFRNITDIGEVEHTLGTIADVMMSSSLTSDRSVFLSERLNIIDNTDSEPVRACRFGSFFEISTYDGKKKWEFGFEPNYGVLKGNKDIDKVIAKAYRNYAIWVDNSPAIMKITTYDTRFTELACAIERAWTNKITYTYTFVCTVPSPGSSTNRCYVYTDSYGRICLDDWQHRSSGEECRSMNGAKVEQWYANPGTIKLRVIPIKNISGASTNCDNPTTFEDDENVKQSTAVKTVVLCPD